MLYPQQNPQRQLLRLDGVWNAVFDPEHIGIDKNYHRVESGDTFETAVPGSVNETAVNRRDYTNMDWVWYNCRFFVPESWKDRRVFLRFGSVTKNCAVWVNGKEVGGDGDGWLSFEFELDRELIYDAENFLAVRVDNALSATTIPQGGLDPALGGVASWRPGNYPDVHYDFFPFMGIHRPVYLYATGLIKLESARLTTLKLEGDRVAFKVEADWLGTARHYKIEVPELLEEFSGDCAGQELSLEAALSGIIPWSPENPKLYKVVVSLWNDDGDRDQYTVDFGFRTVAVTANQLLLNGRPVFLKGFGRHEDNPGSGRGLSLPWMTKDFALMKWIGANSFRTSHYPYSEETLDMADRQGFLVIDEAAANTLSMKAVGEADKKLLAENHDAHVRRLMERDWNHPSVIVWSLGNECETYIPEGKGYFRSRVERAKRFDASRPVTFVINSRAETELEADSFDLLCVNAYPAWYEFCGRTEEIPQRLTKLLRDFHAKYRKPVLLSEFGADCIPGMHSVNNLQWSEEYQSELVEEVLGVCGKLDFVVGTHVWNFADFAVGQHFNRPMFNWKGLFTRERTPKMAAHTVRRLWKKKEE